MTDNKRRPSGRGLSRLSGYLKKGDMITIAVLLGLSLLLGILSALPERRSDKGGVPCAVITRGGTELARLPLDTDCRYVVSGGDIINVIEISDGAAFMSEANCPDRLCVASGRISRGGQMIVCLPAKVVVTIESEDAEAPDSTAY